MSFNKYYIPSPEDFARLIKQNGPKHTVNRKIDAIIGNSDSIEMFEIAHDLLEAGSSEPDVIEALTQKFPEHFNAESN